MKYQISITANINIEAENEEQARDIFWDICGERLDTLKGVEIVKVKES